MCGITGVVYTDLTRSVDPEQFRRATHTLVHRGPDAEGYFFAPGVALGHRRLSIIDLSTGDQPIYNEDGTKAVIFNGEIYNFRELRSELESLGHRFRTTSDTEAIVHAWEQYGDACVTRLRGMFALALWDLTHRRLLLARDRIGKKPLYYLYDPERLLFASELKALVAHPDVTRELDLEALDDYLAFGCIPPPRTAYRSIAKLPPGHYLVWQNGQIRLAEYWDLVFPEGPPRTEADYLEQFDSLLTEAVRLRMISDVPLGAFLSGGVDSSAVVASMAAQSPRPVATTTIAFNERAFSEATHARLVARTLATDHREVVVVPKAIEVLPKLVWHLDEPFADSSALPTYYVASAARERVTVALSGDGGDELFAGYEWRYGLSLIEHRIRRCLPLWLRSALLSPLSAVWPKGDRLPRFLRWKFLLRNLSLQPERAYFYDMSLFTPEEKARLLTPDLRRQLIHHDSFELYDHYFRKVRTLPHLNQILYVDTKTYLPNDILVKVDRMTMASSLEVRSPLLDHKIIEFAASLPPSLKYHRTTSKYLLKRHLQRRLPSSLVHRRKMGFSIPLAQWLRDDLRDSSADLLFSSRAIARGYFELNQLRHLWDQHQRGQRDHSHRLWALMVLELWHRRFVDCVA